MCNVEFKSEMIGPIQEFEKYLHGKKLNDFRERCQFIYSIVEIYDVLISDVVFYKNPYLFTLKGEDFKDTVLVKVEGNKGYLIVTNKKTKEIRKAILNFSTKRYLML